MAAVPELLQQQEEDRSKLRSVSVDLNVDPSLQIDIPDALSERDKVKFTVHTKTTLPTFQSPEFSVTRQHEDFVWLHDTLTETADYAGLIIPPAPTKPDFDGPREKMQKLGEGEGSMTKEEFAKMKQELEAEYLAVFKKTVSSHEVFLQRLSSHPVLSKDRNFHVFLEYDQDLSVRRKNTKEMFGGFFKSVVKSADEVLFSGVKEVDDFFEQEKNFLINYYNRIKDSCAKADKMTRSHKSKYHSPTSHLTFYMPAVHIKRAVLVSADVADDYIHTAASLHSLALEEPTVIKKYLLKVAELFEKLRKVEGRVSSDEDLKLTELLRYYMLNIEAAKDLLYRRTKALIDYENSNKALDKARLKSKDVKLAEAHQQECCQKFEHLSESAKEELSNFKRKRVAAFRKNLIEMSELEIKHARNNVSLLQSCIDLFKNN
ncbi:sorting nexin-5 isoform X1 [Rousettus aegyptiacus]|uniref:sorting nexin-5 isoform X1 n=1 Tax=Rousettus aegyptiacus TaxID=9407 RepID=UPI000789238E|nr:sorting nexin-5 isoform X1 [Rousettus aegyptiacus]XP_036085589.1 sorting nexin-5 isoform X1 [Rousettus aegyptiacus]XP_036085590.1 sorting nexin-5 isoform X1 [Rousettus aegyptiacus]